MTVRLERAYARHLKGAVRARVDQFLQRTGIGLSLGVHGISARIQLDPKADPLPALHALLDLPLRLEQSGGYRALIAFDEFQDVAEGAGPRRADPQPHPVPRRRRVVRLRRLRAGTDEAALRGSRPAALRLGGADAPRAARARRTSARTSRRRFEDTGRGVGEALGPLLQAADGHPQRAMLLAHRLWAQVERGSSATLEDWHAAHEAALAELAAEFDAEWRHLDTSEQKTLRSVLEGDGSPYRGDVLARLALTKDMVRKALPRLAASALIERNGDRHELVDPLLAEWIRRGADPPE